MTITVAVGSSTVPVNGGVVSLVTNIKSMSTRGTIVSGTSDTTTGVDSGRGLGRTGMGISSLTIVGGVSIPEVCSELTISTRGLSRSAIGISLSECFDT